MEAQSSIVLELQRLATDKSHDVVDLCRKALLVATKLKLDDFREWLQCELHGYKLPNAVPGYRKLHCQLSLKNPYHGLVPYVFADKDTAKVFSEVDAREPIGGIVDLLTSPDGEEIYFSFQPEHMAYLMEAQERIQGFCLAPVRSAGRNQVAAVVDIVRTTILEWALGLEAEGILGDGLTFSQAEQKRAAAAQSVHIQNFQGILGNVSNSTVSQDQTMVVRTGDLTSLKKYLRSSGLSADDVKELVAAIKADPKPEKPDEYGPKVGAWIGKMVGKAASGAWNIGVDAAGSLLASAIGAHYGWPR